VNEITSVCVAKEKASFCLSAFLRGSSTKATQLPTFSCLKEPNKIKTDVWFHVLLKTTSNNMA
jgi:hypothetical protein